jgi:hypothetical protein
MGLPVIIKTNITKNTSAVQRAAFNIPLFIYDAGDSTAPDVDFTGRVRVYTSIDSVLDDFADTDVVYLAVSAYLRQNPAVSQVIIGQYYSAGTADASYVAAATACSLENDTWYQIGMEDHTETEVLAMAAYVEAKQRLFFTSNNVVSSVDTAYVAGSAASGDIAGKLADANYERSVVLWHHEADTKFPECAFAGHNLPFREGTANWAFLALSGVGASQNALGNVLTDTQITNVSARNANFVFSQRGQFRTWKGQSASSEWIDLVRGTDGLREDIDASLLDLLINQKGGGIRMTDAGLAQIENVIDSVLTRWVGYGFIQENYTITMPKAIDIPFADKANRIIRDIKFEAFLAGFVNEINPISGNVTYEVAA